MPEEVDKLYTARKRAHEAKTVFEHPLLQDALKHMEHIYTEVWKRSKDPQARELAWFGIQATEMVNDHLKRIMESGRLADAEISRLVNREEEKKRAMRGA